MAECPVAASQDSRSTIADCSGPGLHVLRREKDERAAQTESSVHPPTVYHPKRGPIFCRSEAPEPPVHSCGASPR
eukprot:5243849-Pyramimonas_sp.AAC.1